MQTIVIGGGCFWCLDSLFRLVKGVTNVTSGYAGGTVQNPTYDAVSSGTTGHAEVVQITFDPTSITLKTILELFWSTHDPTTPNKQGADEGPQYRSIVLYADEEQKVIAESCKKDMQQYWAQPIVSEINRLEVFYPAEPYHQNYFANNPNQAYCQLVINPKLATFKAQYGDLLQ